MSAMQVANEADVIESAARIEMLQQNWALIEPAGDDGARVCSISDTSGGLRRDYLPLGLDEAHKALRRNGFRYFADEPDLQAFLHPPSPPSRRTTHPSGPI